MACLDSQQIVQKLNLNASAASTGEPVRQSMFQSIVDKTKAHVSQKISFNY